MQKKFTLLGTLRNHLKVVHIREKYFTCTHEDCAESQKTYEERKNARVQVKRAHQETTKEQVDKFIKIHQRNAVQPEPSNISTGENEQVEQVQPVRV